MARAIQKDEDGTRDAWKENGIQKKWEMRMMWRHQGDIGEKIKMEEEKERDRDGKRTGDSREEGRERYKTLWMGQEMETMGDMTRGGEREKDNRGEDTTREINIR